MPKTLFFSISSTPVFRNFFFFPGSLFEQLKAVLNRGEDFRVVFLLPPKDYEKYLPFLEKSLDERCAAEAVPIPSPKENFLQRLFYFFYSYLIYTNTTKIMASWGMRPEEPPAGGKWYLAPLKRGIAVTFGRIQKLKTKLVPYLYYRVYRDRPFAVLFDKYKPDLIFTPHIYGQFDTRLLAEAKLRDVKTIGMAAGWDHLDKYFLPFRADKFLVQNTQMKNAAIKFQSYDANNIIEVGYPHFDFFVSSDKFILSREQVLKSLGFPSLSKYILYISGSAYSPDEPEVIETILQWADQGKFGCDLRFVIRPYLGGRGRDREFDEKKFNNFENHPRAAFYRRDFWWDLDMAKYFLNVMRHADVVICVYSTALLEAAIFDRPLVVLAFDGYHKRPLRRSIRRFQQFDHFQEVFKTGAVRTAYSFDGLFTILDEYLKDPTRDAEGREKLRRSVCHRLDGLVSQEVLNQLLAQLKVGLDV